MNDGFTDGDSECLGRIEVLLEEIRDRLPEPVEHVEETTQPMAVGDYLAFGELAKICQTMSLQWGYEINLDESINRMRTQLHVLRERGLIQ